MKLDLEADDLRPLIKAVVVEVLEQLEKDQATLGNNRLAYSEAEAAALLGMQGYQLRDERLKGRIKASVGPGRRVLYSHGDLMAYLAERRWKSGKH